MFFSSTHPEDKRMFGILVVAAILIIGLIGYAVLEFGTRVRPEPAKPIQKAYADLQVDQELFQAETLNAQIRSIEETNDQLTVIKLKEKLENQN